MRNLALIAAILLSLPVCFARPFFGGLVWTVLAFLNPQKMTWGTSVSLALPVAVATIVGFLLSNEPKRLLRSPGTYGLLALLVSVTASTMVAHNPADAYDALDERLKIMLMLFVIMSMTNTHERLQIVCLVTALSLGYHGLRGGIFTVVTGGQFRVYGPENTFIGDNNALALALNMTVPMLFYLRREFRQRGMRLMLLVTGGGCLIAILGTYSRGGLLGLAVVVGVLALKMRHRWLGIILLAGAVFAVPYVMPMQWSNRMETIETYEQDNSAMARLNAWHLAWLLALERPVLGWGPQAMEDKSLYDKYFPQSPTRADVHSSYFQLLSETGFPGLSIFLFVIAWALITQRRLSSRFRGSTEHGWVATYADMLQVSTAAYAVSGAFLELGYFDLFYHVIGFTIVLQDMARGLAVAAGAPASAKPAPRLNPARLPPRPSPPARPGLPVGVAARLRGVGARAQ